MRVLQVVHGFPPWAMGGTEVYAHALSRTLAARCGAEVFVLTREADPSLPEYNVREEQRDGLSLTIVNNTFAAPRSFEDSYRQPPIRRIGAALLDSVRPDIVHVQHLTCLSTDLLAECSRRAIPTVVTLNDFWFLCHRGQLLNERLERCAGPSPSGCAKCIGAAGTAGAGSYRVAAGLRRLGLPVPSSTGPIATGLRAMRGEEAGVDASVSRLLHMRDACATVTEFLAPSRTVKDRFVEFGIPEARIALHEYGIDQSRLEGLERTAGDRLRIGFVGSMMVSKGPHLLLEAFAQLPPGAASLHVFGGHAAYHGDDRYRERLDPLLCLPGVHWAGPVPHERIPEAMAALDVLVVPSIWLENSPLVIREAFAAGLPVVASDLGGMAELVTHEGSGLLFEAGNAQALALALARLLDEPELLPRLRRGLPPVRTIADDAEATFARYRALVTGRPALEPEAPAMAAVVLNYRTPAETERAVRSLAASHRPLSSILVVDNGSEDGSVERLRAALPDVTILESPSNLGFSGGCNLGIAEAIRRGAELLLLVNSDAEVAPETVQRMEDAILADDGHGIAVPVLLSWTDPPWVLSAGIAFSTATGRMRHHGFGRTHAPSAASPAGGREVVDAASGCVMLIRREVFERIGYLDESFFYSFEDIDFCLRARRAGFRTVVAADAHARHDGSRTIGARSPRKLYFATRNHLRAAARTGDTRFPFHHTLRSGWIVVLNLAFALRPGGAPRLEGLRNVAVGAWHHLRGRYGDGP